MTVFGLILMRYFLHYGPISVKKCCVIFCIMRYAIFSLRYTFFKVIMQRTNTVLQTIRQISSGRFFFDSNGQKSSYVSVSQALLVFGLQ